MGRLLFIIDDDLHKLFRRYCRDMAGGKVLGVSGDNIIGGKPFPNGELNGVLKIVPIQFQRLKDMAVCYCGRIKDLYKALYSFTCGAFPSSFRAT